MTVTKIGTPIFERGPDGQTRTPSISSLAQAGDTLLLAVSSCAATAVSPYVPPAGWTLVASSLDASASIPKRLWVWTRQAVAGDAGTTVSVTTGGSTTSSYSSVAVIAVYRGVTQPIQAAAAVSGTPPAVALGAVVASFVAGRYAFSTVPSGANLRGTDGVNSGFLAWADWTDGTHNAGPAPGPTAGTNSITVVLADNVAPNAPTLTTMIGGVVLDRAAVNRASHTFSDPDPGDSQAAFDHRYRLVGAAPWTTAYVASPNGYVDYPAGTFAAGDYERQVRTYDAQGVVGPWSASGFFTAADAPATPTITAPVNGATIGAPSATVTWSAPAQEAYQVQVLDGGLVLNDSGVVVSTAKSYVAPFPDNGTTRQVRVRVRYQGLWSSWYTVTVTVSYTPPPVPTVALAAGSTSLTVTVTNPAPGVGQPAVTHNQVYVDDDLADGETLRVEALAANGVWTYWTPRSGLDYAGRVRVEAVAANGTRTTSA